MNYLNIQIKKSNKIFKKPLIKKKCTISKSFNKNIEEINNINETENKNDTKLINKKLNLYQYMNNKNVRTNIKKNNKIDKNVLNIETNKEIEEKCDYTFDEEFIMNEVKNLDDFDELCNTTHNNIFLSNNNNNNKNKSGLNIFLNKSANKKDFKIRKQEEIKQIINRIKK